MQPFTPNAADYNDGSSLDGLPFHATGQALNFLSARPTRFLVCGLKGIGKTLLLVKRSESDRKAHSGTVFIPKYQRVEKLTEIGSALSEQSVRDLSDPSTWRKLWVATLTHVVATQAAPEAFESEAERDLYSGCDGSIGATIRTAIERRTSKVHRDFIDTGAARLLARTIAQVREGVRIYVDAVDELTNSHIGDTLKHSLEGRNVQGGKHAAEVWAASQIGFALAAVDIRQSNSHIKIFATMRREALDLIDFPLKQNIESHVLEVKYSLADLRGIWNAKLLALKQHFPSFFAVQSDAPQSDTPDLNSLFFGFDSIPHPYVANLDGRPIAETPLDYLIRHTRGRPRELDHLGHALQYTSVESRTPEFVRTLIREQSKTFYKWAQTEPTPFWNDAHDLLLKALDTNILTRKERDSVFDRLVLENGLSHSELEQQTVQLFHLGLIGYVKRRQQGNVQAFNQSDPEIDADITEFLNAEHFAVHPCVNLRWFALRPVYTPNRWNIVGHGLPFGRVGAEPHAHIGAGPLGMGVVVNMLLQNRGITTAVIQHKTQLNTNHWAKLPASGESIALELEIPDVSEGRTLTRELEIGLTVLADDADEALSDRMVSEWRSGSRNLFIYSNDVTLMAKVLSACGSYSTAAGKGLSQVVESLLLHGAKASFIYPFENDEQLVNLADTRLGTAGFRCKHVVVDRICTQTRVEPTRIIVTCERYAAVVINDGSARTRQLFANSMQDGSIVELVEDDVLFKYRHDRKRLLVNGVHFAFAVLGYSKLIDIGLGKLPRTLAHEPIMGLFIGDSNIADTVRSMSRLFIASLILRRTDLTLANDGESSLDREMRSLITYSNEVFDRFERNPDRLDRVLKMDIAGSYTKFGRFFIGELTRWSVDDLQRLESLWNRWFDKNWHSTVRFQLKVFKEHFDKVSSSFLMD